MVGKGDANQNNLGTESDKLVKLPVRRASIGINIEDVQIDVGGKKR
jgi:hypothetical protein